MSAAIADLRDTVPQYLVQVIFNEIAHSDETGNRNWFINKRPVPREQIWIRGDIRAGRSDKQKTAIAERISNECAEATGIDKSYFWVYISDLAKASEFGGVLPEPRQEKEWLAQIPKSVRERYGLPLE